MENKSISILGCGWLGLAFGKKLVSEGWNVKSSSRQYEKTALFQKFNIRNFVIDLNPHVNGNIPVFLDSEILMISIPPSIRTQSAGFHVRQMENLIPHIQKSTIKNIIYISSTSVYPDLDRTFAEGDISKETPLGHADIFFAEEKLKEALQDRLTILRCGGLTGYDRLLAKYFAGRKEILGGHVPVNLVHRDDVISVISSIIEKNIWGKTFNVVAGNHPTRKEFYTFEAKKYGMQAPEFSEETVTPWKIIDNSKLVKELGYNFIYNDPHNFAYLV